MVQLCALCTRGLAWRADEPVLIEVGALTNAALPTLFAGGIVRQILRNLLADELLARPPSPPDPGLI